MKKLGIMLSIILCLLLTTVACSTQTEETTTETTMVTETATATTSVTSSPTETAAAFQPFTFIDAFGREVSIDEPLERIALGHHIFAEFLVGISAQDTVVTVLTNVAADEIFYPELSQKPALSNPYMETPDYETIIASGAQVYLMNGLLAYEEQYLQAVEKLEPAVQVIGLSTQEQQDFYDTVEILGKMTGHEKEAAAYNQLPRDVFELIAERVSDMAEEDVVRVYFEPMRAGWTVNDNCMGYGFMVPAAGGINLAGADMSHEVDWFEVDKEWLATQNPDYIIMRSSTAYPEGYDTDSYDGLADHVAQAMARAELSQSDAVQNGNVYVIGGDLVGTPRIFIAVAYMAKVFYPDLFEDLDPQAIHQEYLDTFIGIDYDLSQHGAFIYPAP